jgi:carbon storage regulator
MLIMWRRTGEGLRVGDEVDIHVLDARSNRVKLGIVAPGRVPVLRKEAQTTRDQNLAAALSADRSMVDALLRLARPTASLSGNVK